jgi:hypothetical protein
MADPQPPADPENPAAPEAAADVQDPVPQQSPVDPQLPANSNYVFVAAPVDLAHLKALLASIESTDDVNAFNELFPTNSWVTHVYSAIQTDPETEISTNGYVILYEAPPFGTPPDAPSRVQAVAVEGADDSQMALNAAALVGSSELIGYEDFDASTRVVIFRVSDATVPPVPVPGRLSWETSDHPERRNWSMRLTSLVGQSKTKLDQGNPNAFIAGYSGLSNPMQVKFWAEMLVAIAKFESAWKPTDVYHESFGVNSVGLLQLSFQDGANYHLTPPIGSEEGLKDPLLNLTWGAAIFSRWLARDKVVASGSGDASRGSARYWSTMRTGHKVEFIKALTKKNVGL